MLAVAQTNLQLYRQLADQGAGPSDLAAVRSAYDVSASLFAGVYRASGKTFVAHVVGTASILGAQGVPVPLVAAGLLHAAYNRGEFGDGPPGRTQRRAARMARAVGAEVEGLVARYATFPWKAGDLSALRDLPASLGRLDRDVLVIRLANEAEEIVDGDILHHADAESRRQLDLEALPVWIAWANAVSVPDIALALQVSATRLAAGRPPDSLRTDRAQSYHPPAVSPPTAATLVSHALWRGLHAVHRLGRPPR